MTLQLEAVIPAAAVCSEGWEGDDGWIWEGSGATGANPPL